MFRQLERFWTLILNFFFSFLTGPLLVVMGLPVSFHIPANCSLGVKRTWLVWPWLKLCRPACQTRHQLLVSLYVMSCRLGPLCQKRWLVALIETFEAKVKTQTKPLHLRATDALKSGCTKNWVDWTTNYQPEDSIVLELWAIWNSSLHCPD